MVFVCESYLIFDNLQLSLSLSVNPSFGLHVLTETCSRVTVYGPGRSVHPVVITIVIPPPLGFDV